jgi:hypothetical protein
MMKSVLRIGHGLAWPAISLALAGCMATQGTVVPTKTSESASASSGSGSGFKIPWFGAQEKPAAPAVAPAPTPTPTPNAKTAGASAAAATLPVSNLPPLSRTTVEVQCKTPLENYDFASTIGTRFGAEGQARLQRLLSTDFNSASLTPQDRAILKVMSTEMLWIPVPVEEKIGSALLIASSRELTVLENEGANKPLWTKTVAMVSDLSSVSPPNPFELRLILLQKGAPGSLAGGVIFVDNETLKSTFDDDSPYAEEKLRFVLAHELAHIYKRHRAKRIQQVLVDSDSGLKLMRQIVTRGQMKGGGTTVAAVKEWIETISAVPQVAQDLFKKHEKYGMDQEFEADACATAMMMGASLGNPLRAFRAYTKDAAQFQGAILPTGTNAVAATGETMRTHPPDSEREANIDRKMREFAGGAAPKITPPAAVGNKAKPPANRTKGTAS